MSISAIIPAFNAAKEVKECLAALGASSEQPAEIIVVDDASTDDTAAIAAATGARVVRQRENRGPAGARNVGAAHARGDVLFFVDADVAVAPDAVARVARLFATCPDVAAVFGSYDTKPRAPGVVSQYRNLLHHYVHQHGSVEAFTFWAGCGALRRAAFAAVGGFDERPAWHFIEDIELGHRLRRDGYRIRLDKELRATHLKRWTLVTVVRTDLLFRAAPWARLIRQSATAPADLNLTGGQRLSVGLMGVAAICLPLALVYRTLALVAGLTLAGIVVLNRGLYAFLYRERGLGFALACVPLHVLYFLCSGAGFVYGVLTPPTPRARRVSSGE
jgi:glycosyltransferase involved in cell wall biosynthesis